AFPDASIVTTSPAVSMIPVPVAGELAGTITVVVVAARARGLAASEDATAAVRRPTARTTNIPLSFQCCPTVVLNVLDLLVTLPPSLTAHRHAGATPSGQGDRPRPPRAEGP